MARASTFSPEIWQKFAEELTDKELRLLCGSHTAVFMTAMERFYFEAAHSQFGYKIARVAQRTMSETTGTGPKVIAR